ncbi:gliding-associated putative ABC transporter substrate-binding component GldG [Pustulibacterium marinum]|uniref:Gliding-associated putative ABC transporter substrate-binding component GldG n=1 Tax=Pustulibacterium marinum TaxID=1224947 RepID=A0A1I7GC41_9FLAO|nr:gliding motility-associated ABC transporter substrate-binding protein GldG [Pustulibacterium marinum]SFU46029.1 gliding-associated putative ABC transporter substrate-binding component GldG [Pustulibacterium marinum]
MLKKTIVQILLVAVVLVVINWVFSGLYLRFDVTKDKRYTLSETTLQTLENIEKPLVVDVLLQGDFPAQFKKLQFETKQLLEQYEAENNNIVFNFINPLEGEENPEQLINNMMNMGMPPTNIPVTENGRKTVTQIFPWAIANYGQKTVLVPLLINNFGNDGQENITKSVQQLEYNFTDAITKLTIQQKKRVAILKGNGELDEKYMGDFLVHLKQYYALGKFDFDSLQNDPQKTLENLNYFDAAIVAKPTKAFSDNERYILDQYIMNGGKVLWALDKVAVDLDSLQNQTQSTVALPRKLNLDDMLFKYGVRINYNLVEDFISTPITVQGQQGKNIPIDWPLSPIVLSPENHPINKNINVVKLEFANQIDLLDNGIKETVLLQSSPQSAVEGTPAEISLNQFANLQPQYFTKGPQNLAVLLEGDFTSAFKNRVKPFDLKTDLTNTKAGKMIVISDGDIFNYMYANKKPLVNGIDPWTQQIYGNKDFLINCMNYLLEDNGLINIRGKEIKLAFLDNQKIENEKWQWKLLNVVLPAVLLIIFGIVFFVLRKRMYTK